MGATGTAVIDFGAVPGTDIASVTVTGQAGVLSGSAVEAWIMGSDSTADYTAYEHMFLARHITVTPTAVNAGAGFELTAIGELMLVGQVAIRWVWD